MDRPRGALKHQLYEIERIKTDQTNELCKFISQLPIELHLEILKFLNITDQFSADPILQWQIFLRNPYYFPKFLAMRLKICLENDSISYFKTTNTEIFNAILTPKYLNCFKNDSDPKRQINTFVKNLNLNNQDKIDYDFIKKLTIIISEMSKSGIFATHNDTILDFNYDGCITKYIAERVHSYKQAQEDKKQIKDTYNEIKAEREKVKKEKEEWGKRKKCSLKS